jgi:LPS export ABC transporter protein LptC
MPRKLANALLILFLLIVAVVSWQWLDDRAPDQELAQLTVPMAENETDYTLEDFTITNVNNAKGQVYQLRGRSLAHFVNGSASVIDSPSIQMTGDDNQRWSGDAHAGYLSNDFSRLELVGDVRLSHVRENNPPVHVTTELLDIDTRSRQMQTTEAVSINGEQWSFQAAEMQADLDNGILNFQSGVEANYAVPE